MTERRPWWMTNRQWSRRARLGRAWCRGCDHGLVTEGGRCAVCGRRDDRIRDKKPAPTNGAPE